MLLATHILPLLQETSKMNWISPTWIKALIPSSTAYDVTFTIKIILNSVSRQRKFDLSLDVAFETSVTFNVNSILTEEFVDSDFLTSDTRSVSIEVLKGDCDSNPTCNILTDDCYSGAHNVAIGETLELCIKAPDADVKVKGLESATLVAGTFSSQIVRPNITGQVGSTNFVTKSVVNEVGEVTLSTLLITAYYDSLKADDFISISGVALLEYTSMTRRLHWSESGRLLKMSRFDRSPFVVSVPLEKFDPPLIVRSKTNSSTRATIATFRFMPVSILLPLFYILL